MDDSKTPKNIMKAMAMLKELTIMFPIHPRTRQRLATVKLLKQLEAANHIEVVEPIGYHEMLQLTEHAKMVFTDSGGLQKEAFWLHTLCTTLRDRTESIETIELGANVLARSNTQKIVVAARKILETKDIKIKLEKLNNPFGNGQASEKIIADALKRR